MKKHILYLLLFVFSFSLSAQLRDRVFYRSEQISTVKIDNFDKIEHPGSFFIQEEGLPELPVLTKKFVLPINAQVTGITISSVQKQKKEGTYLIYPVQPPIPTNATERPIFVSAKAAVYNSNQPFPGKYAEVSEQVDMMGYNVVHINVYPLEYYPVTKELYLCDISYQINYTIGNTSSSTAPMQISERRARINRSLVESTVENPQQIDTYAPINRTIITPSTDMNLYGDTPKTQSKQKTINVIQELPPDYIIITSNALKDTFQVLADWKIKKGVPAIIKTVEDIKATYQGSDTQEKIRNYLIECYNKWGDGLFVLLGGGVDIIPARMVKGTSYPKLLFATDAYYATKFKWDPKNISICGENNMTRINYLGRIPCKNTLEAASYIRKLMQYEQLQSVLDRTYLKNHLVADAYISLSEQSMKLDVLDGNTIKTYYQNIQKETSELWYLFDNHSCENPPPFIYANCAIGNNELNKLNFQSAINHGIPERGHFYFVYHMDHSSPYGMGTSSKMKAESIGVADMELINNSPYYQILMSGGCHPADFTADCIASKYLHNPNGGGVAFIGNTDVGYSTEHQQLDKLLKGAYLSPYLFRLGSLFNNISVSQHRLHLLGDPETPIYTKVPSSFNVQKSSNTLYAGQNNITITISSSNLSQGNIATVCLQKGTEGYAYKDVVIGANGQGVATFTFTPHTPGEVSLTVTAPNCLPYQESIPVVVNPNAYLYIEDLIWDDIAGGNGNGKIEAGETVALKAKIKNGGNSVLQNLVCKLISNHTNVEIVEDSVFFGNIAAGSSIVPLKSFTLKINKEMEQRLINESETEKLFSLIMLPSKEVIQSFNTPIYAPNIELTTRKTIALSSMYPGANVEMKAFFTNTGSGDTKIKGTIYHNNQPIGSAGFIPSLAYAQTTDSISIPIRLPQGYTQGTVFNVTLSLENEYGRKNDFILDLNADNNNVIITNLSCKSQRNSIQLTWNTPSASTFFVYKSTAKDGIYTKQNQVPLEFSFFDDVNVTLGNIYFYKISTVDSKYIEGKCSNFLTSTLSYPQIDKSPIELRNQVNPVPSNMTTINSVNIYRNSNKQSRIFSSMTPYQIYNKAYIVGLDSLGKGLFNIDRNESNTSGFAFLSNNMQSTPAVGEIAPDNDALITVSRENSPNIIACYSLSDNDGDGKPDQLWTTNSNGSGSYRGVVLAPKDESGNGYMNAIVKEEWEYPLRIYDTQNGQELYSSAQIHTQISAPAVADLNGDGRTEIILGTKDQGICILQQNGNSYPEPGNSISFFNENNYTFASSPVVADINNDGQKEILIIAFQKSSSNSKIFVINGQQSNTLLFSVDAPSHHTSPDYFSQELSVGDINGDGNLEIVATGVNTLRVWDYNGNVLLNKHIPNINAFKTVPLIADVSGDGIPEIIVVVQNEIHAYDINGNIALGFPLTLESAVQGTPGIQDIDNDGKNEVIASTEKIYIWRTNGKPSAIEWGLERYDSSNTGCYPCKTQTLYNGSHSNHKYVCGDLVIKGTYSFPISRSMLYMQGNKIIVESGGNLTLSNIVINAQIEVKSGGTLNIINGRINLTHPGALIVHKGGILNYQSGSIQ